MKAQLAILFLNILSLSIVFIIIVVRSRYKWLLMKIIPRSPKQHKMMAHYYNCHNKAVFIKDCLKSVCIQEELPEIAYQCAHRRVLIGFQSSSTVLIFTCSGWSPIFFFIKTKNIQRNSYFFLRKYPWPRILKISVRTLHCITKMQIFQLNYLAFQNFLTTLPNRSDFCQFYYIHVHVNSGVMPVLYPDLQKSNYAEILL